jgi:hypothetical protein
MGSKLVDSFSSSEFSVDFFVTESLRNTPAHSVLEQLNRCESELEAEHQKILHETLNLIRQSNERADSTLGSLLAMRENLALSKQTLELLRNAERARLTKLRQKLDQLGVAHELSLLARSKSRIIS